MKEKFLTISLLLLTLNVFGQDCEKKLAVNEIDFVTKNKVIKSAYMSYKVNFKSNYTISFKLKDRKLNIVTTSTSKNVNGKGNVIEFNFDNGKKVKINFKNNSISKIIKKQSIYINEEEISYENLKLFAEKPIKTVEIKGIHKLIEIKEKRAEIIIEYTNCFFMNIDKDMDLGEEKEKSRIPDYYKPCNIVRDEVDEFEGYRIKELHYAGIARTKKSGLFLFATLKKLDNELWLTAKLDAFSYCISNNSRINIKLENGSIIRLKNSSGVNCGKQSVFLIKLDKTTINLLNKNPIKLVRFETEDGIIDFKYITIKNYFIENLNCL